MPHKILTKDQQKVIRLIAAEPKMADFYLTGGTALAGFYLQHRLSDDLDFFTGTPPDPIFLHAFANKIQQVLDAESVRFDKIYDRNQFFFQLKNTELKLEFALYPFPQIIKPKIIGGIKVDSLRDIAANKLMAMLDRFDPKDFADLYFLLKKFGLEKIRRDAEKKFGAKIDNIFLGGELMKSQRIEALPKMIKPLAIKQLKDFFAKQATYLKNKILK